MNQYLAIREIREILLKAMEKAADTELSQYLHQIDEKLEFFLKKDIDFKEIVDGLDDGIFITDHQGNVLYVNPAYTRNTGITQEDVLNHNITELTGEDKLVYRRRCSRCAKNRQTGFPPFYYLQHRKTSDRTCYRHPHL